MADINIKSTTIEKTLDLAKGFVEKLFGPTIDEYGLTLADNVKLYRLKNQIKNFKKIQKIVDDNNMQIRDINLKILIPYLDAIGLEDDDYIQDAWANLISNYLDSSKNLFSNVYPAILRQLATNELLFLESLFYNSRKKPRSFEGPQTTDEECGNLLRLGLIEERTEFNQYGAGRYDGGSDIKIEEISTGEFDLTTFGYNFYRAYHRDDSVDFNKA